MPPTSFLGIGMGMILGKRTHSLRAKFSALVAFFFALIWARTRLGFNIAYSQCRNVEQ